jgi:hypothetical protein
MLIVDILQLPESRPPVRRISRNWTLWIISSTTAPSPLSLPYRAQINYQPSRNSQFRSAFLSPFVTYSLGADPTENITFNNSSFVVMGGYLAIARILLTCLPAVTKQRLLSRDRCIATVLHATSLLSLHQPYFCPPFIYKTVLLHSTSIRAATTQSVCSRPQWIHYSVPWHRICSDDDLQFHGSSLYSCWCRIHYWLLTWLFKISLNLYNYRWGGQGTWHVWQGEPEETRLLEKPRNWQEILKSVQGPVADSCGHSDEPSRSIKCWQFI